MALPVLWHFTVSHFNEKVRWALDFKRIPHVRRALLPGFHFLKVWRMTGQTAVPVLVLDGRPIHDSTRIIEAVERAYPEPPLYPRDESERRRALALEDFFDEQFGPSIRAMLVHAQFVHDPELTAATVHGRHGTRKPADAPNDLTRSSVRSIGSATRSTPRAPRSHERRPSRRSTASSASSSRAATSSGTASASPT